jgi:hypothetical protein
VTIRLWDGLDDLNFLVGADFPDADEDALRRCARAWTDAAAQLHALGPDAVRAGTRVAEMLGGRTGAAFTEVWQRFTTDGEGFIDRLSAACGELGTFCDQAAAEVEYAKIQYIAALVLLGATIASLLAMIWAGGVSAGGIPIAVAAAQVTIRLILVRLLTSMVISTTLNVLIDGLAQGLQMLNGHRDEWDWAKTRRSAEGGAVYGAVGAGVFLAGGRLAPRLVSTPAGLFGAAGTVGAIGGVADPLLHGEVPTVQDVLLAMASGVAGGLGPDLVTGHHPASPLRPGVLARLDIRSTVDDVEALDVARTHALTTNAGVAFYPDGDEIRPFAEAVDPTEGYVTVDLHGASDGFRIGTTLLTPEQFARTLRHLIDEGAIELPEGTGIKLLSCETAAGGNQSAAARLARELGIEVIAPDQAVWTAMDGTEIVSSPMMFGGAWVPTYPPDGGWRRFSPTGAEIPFGPDPSAAPEAPGAPYPTPPTDARPRLPDPDQASRVAR